MGYEQHIFRSEENNQILREEYEQVINSDDSLIPSDSNEDTVEWIGHPLGGIEGQFPLLFYGAGRISSKHPDEFVTKKLFEIAKKMDARLGDDEVVFDDAYRQEIEESCKRILERSKRIRNKPKWKFW